MLTGENGILNRAKETKEKTEIATEEEQNTLLQYEYEIAKMQGKISEAETFGEYSMEREIKEKYGQDIKIGDTVNYEDEVGDYDGGWKVLGIEGGQILLMSSKFVKGVELPGDGEYLDGIKKLNDICAKFDKGKGAEKGSARSLQVEDINKITGYNPEKLLNGKKFREGTILEYGNEVIYTLIDGKIHFKGSNGIEGNGKEETQFFDATRKKLGENGLNEITIICNDYRYAVATLSENFQSPTDSSIPQNETRWRNLFQEIRNFAIMVIRGVLWNSFG